MNLVANHLSLTPIQSRLYSILSDGLPHTRSELRAVIDSQTDYHTLNQHLTELRKAISRRGLAVWCVLHRRTLCYRLARPVSMDCACALAGT